MRRKRNTLLNNILFFISTDMRRKKNNAWNPNTTVVHHSNSVCSVIQSVYYNWSSCKKASQHLICSWLWLAKQLMFGPHVRRPVST